MFLCCFFGGGGGFPILMLHWLMCSPSAVNKFSISSNGLLCEGSEGTNFLLPSWGGIHSTFVLRFYSEISFSAGMILKFWVGMWRIPWQNITRMTQWELNDKYVWTTGTTLEPILAITWQISHTCKTSCFLFETVVYSGVYIGHIASAVHPLQVL